MDPEQPTTTHGAHGRGDRRDERDVLITAAGVERARTRLQKAADRMTPDAWQELRDRYTATAR